MNNSYLILFISLSLQEPLNQINTQLILSLNLHRAENDAPALLTKMLGKKGATNYFDQPSQPLPEPPPITESNENLSMDILLLCITIYVTHLYLKEPA